jgi:hypothetical protein
VIATRPLVVACGALAGDLRAVLTGNGLSDAVEVRYLPANLHNRPEKITAAVEAHVSEAERARRAVFVAYADCGTGGLLDAMLDRHPGVHRLPGAHCYATFTGVDAFAALHDDEVGTLYLTDFLAKHFRPLLWEGLGLDRSPGLRDLYFGNYTRVLLIAQTDDESVTAAAREAAAMLGLAFDRREVGREGLAGPVVAFVQSQPVAVR